MSAKRGTERFSLSRWSRRKLEAAAKPVAPASSAPTPTASLSAARAPTTIATNGLAAPPVAAPATETKVTEIAARGGDSGTTPPAPLQSAKIAAKRAASVAAEREEERALGHRSEANSNISRSDEGDRQ